MTSSLPSTLSHQWVISPNKGQQQQACCAAAAAESTPLPILWRNWRHTPLQYSSIKFARRVWRERENDWFGVWKHLSHLVANCTQNLFISASSAQSERDFSSVWRMRSRLSVDRVEAIELLRWGKRAGIPMNEWIKSETSITACVYGEWLLILQHSTAIHLGLHYLPLDRNTKFMKSIH